MNERLIWQGQKQEAQLKSRQLENSIKGLRDSIRSHLNPHDPISDIDHDLVAQLAFELSDKLIQYRAACDHVAAINKSLGIV